MHNSDHTFLKEHFNELYSIINFDRSLVGERILNCLKKQEPSSEEYQLKINTEDLPYKLLSGELDSNLLDHYNITYSQLVRLKRALLNLGNNNDSELQLGLKSLSKELDDKLNSKKDALYQKYLDDYKRYEVSQRNIYEGKANRLRTRLLKRLVSVFSKLKNK